jgi:hypothetical protein
MSTVAVPPRKKKAQPEPAAAVEDAPGRYRAAWDRFVDDKNVLSLDGQLQALLQYLDARAVYARPVEEVWGALTMEGSPEYPGPVAGPYLEFMRGFNAAPRLRLECLLVYLEELETHPGLTLEEYCQRERSTLRELAQGDNIERNEARDREIAAQGDGAASRRTQKGKPVRSKPAPVPALESAPEDAAAPPFEEVPAGGPPEPAPVKRERKGRKDQALAGRPALYFEPGAGRDLVGTVVRATDKRVDIAVTDTGETLTGLDRRLVEIQGADNPGPERVELTLTDRLRKNFPSFQSWSDRGKAIKGLPPGAVAGCAHTYACASFNVRLTVSNHEAGPVLLLEVFLPGEETPEVFHEPIRRFQPEAYYLVVKGTPYRFEVV